jgi:hypothetical protein
MLYGPALNPLLAFLNRVLDRRHNEAAPAWTLHWSLMYRCCTLLAYRAFVFLLCTIALPSGPSLRAAIEENMQPPAS